MSEEKAANGENIKCANCGYAVDLSHISEWCGFLVALTGRPPATGSLAVDDSAT